MYFTLASAAISHLKWHFCRWVVQHGLCCVYYQHGLLSYSCLKRNYFLHSPPGPNLSPTFSRGACWWAWSGYGLLTVGGFLVFRVCFVIFRSGRASFPLSQNSVLGNYPTSFAIRASSSERPTVACDSMNHWALAVESGSSWECVEDGFLWKGIKMSLPGPSDCLPQFRQYCDLNLWVFILFL